VEERVFAEPNFISKCVAKYVAIYGRRRVDLDHMESFMRKLAENFMRKQAGHFLMNYRAAEEFSFAGCV